MADPTALPLPAEVVIAPDKFKGSLTAAEVAAALAEGIASVAPGVTVRRAPIADGGDGSVDVALAAGFGEVVVRVSGPTGVPHLAHYARDGERAVIELACVCGLQRLPGRLEPVSASTFGLGEVIRHAVEHGVRQIVLALGGSASTDGGAGMVQALGARLVDRDGRELARGGGALVSLASVDLAPVRALLGGVRIVVACDVQNPLLGPEGAAAVFGPQKGAGEADRALLEAGLARWADLVGGDPDQPGAGAAGGTGYAAATILGADLRSGIELILDLLDLRSALESARLVITGEGHLDPQSLAGKGPIGVARAAARAGVPVVAAVGVNLLQPAQLAGTGIVAVYPLTELEPDRARSIAGTAQLLRRVGARIAGEWLGDGRVKAREVHYPMA